MAPGGPRAGGCTARWRACRRGWAASACGYGCWPATRTARSTGWSRRPMPPGCSMEPTLRALGDRAGQDDQGRPGGHGIQAEASTPASVASPGRSSGIAVAALQGSTPYWRAWMGHGALPAPLPAPTRLAPGVEPTTAARWLGASADSARLGCGAARDLGAGEPAAWAALAAFVDGPVKRYEAVDYPAPGRRVAACAALHHGELSPRRIWHPAQAAVRAGTASIIRQLVWREFSYHLLFHFPNYPNAAAAGVHSLPGPRRPGYSAPGPGPDRIPPGRRRDARALAHGLHAQPRADDRRPRF